MRANEDAEFYKLPAHLLSYHDSGGWFPRDHCSASLFCFESFRHPSLQAFGLIALAFSAVVLALISRAYTVRLQDRIIRLEMRLRLERLGKAIEFERLTTPQLVALRFASDAELRDLVDRTLTENLALDQIKSSIDDWQPDFYRT